MAGSTFLIGCLPSYETIAVLSPVLLAICRLLQGFSVGGEVPGAIAYISEAAPERKGFVIGIIYCFFTGELL